MSRLILSSFVAVLGSLTWSTSAQSQAKTQQKYTCEAKCLMVTMESVQVVYVGHFELQPFNVREDSPQEALNQSKEVCRKAAKTGGGVGTYPVEGFLVRAFGLKPYANGIMQDRFSVRQTVVFAKDATVEDCLAVK